MAVEHGADAVFYWQMTYGEIITAIEGYQRRFKAEAQLQAGLIYRLGSLVGIAVNDSKKYPRTVSKAFPGLFDGMDDGQPKQQDWRVMKERMNAYNEYLRRKRGERA